MIGGSVGGLFAASLLRASGWDATVFERTSDDLAGRGAGLGISQELLDVMQRIGAPIDPTAGVPLQTYIWLDGDGTVRHEQPRPMIASAWPRVYRPLRAAFPDEHYRTGWTLDRVEQDDRSVTAVFRDGTRIEGDLLVASDGNLSTVRRQFMPDVEPRYAGYVAWRGVVEERDMPEAVYETVAGHIVFSFHEREMMLTMLVPGAGDDVRAGRRRIYFIWYRPTESEAALADLFTDASGRHHGFAIPPPLIRPEFVREIKALAGEIFAPEVAAVVRAAPQPLLQAISDLESPRLVFGRVALMGDAAFIARPHVAGGITKAALDADCLASALSGGADDIAGALAAYEGKRRDFGAKIVAHSRLLGSYVEQAPGTNGAVRYREPAWIMREYGAPHLLHDPDPAGFVAPVRSA